MEYHLLLLRGLGRKHVKRIRGQLKYVINIIQGRKVLQLFSILLLWFSVYTLRNIFEHFSLKHLYCQAQPSWQAQPSLASWARLSYSVLLVWGQNWSINFKKPILSNKSKQNIGKNSYFSFCSNHTELIGDWKSLTSKTWPLSKVSGVVMSTLRQILLLKFKPSATK